MSQWQELTALCHISLQMQERVKELYGRIRFPYRFRSQFAEWIEAQNWYDLVLVRISLLSYRFRTLIDNQNTFL